MKKVSIILILVLALVLILPACSSTSTTTAPAPAPATSAAPAPAPATSAAPAPVSSAAPAPATTPAAAAKPIELIFSTPGPEVLPEFTYLGGIGPIKQAFLDITQATGGKVTFKNYYGGALNAAGTTYEAVISGAVDIGTDQPSYNKGRFPMTEILELPWGYPSALAASKITWDAFQKFQPKEMNGMMFIFNRCYGHPVIMSNKPVRSINDMKGLKIRGTGNMNDVLTALGAAPVSMPIFEVYDALRKGTMDGALTGPDNFAPYKFNEVVKYVTDVSFMANGMITSTLMNTGKFNSLPPDVQKVFKDSIANVNPKYWDIIEKTMVSGLEYAKSKGLEIITIPAAEIPQWQATAKKVADKYVADSAAKGNNSQEVATWVQDAIKNYK
jgi:TRAP-type transport system periplasmic protein